jgi:hypothetical protein
MGAIQSGKLTIEEITVLRLVTKLLKVCVLLNLNMTRAEKILKTDRSMIDLLEDWMKTREQK